MMRVCVPTLTLLALLTAVLAAPVALTGAAAFTAAVNSTSFTMVKFFSPRCPHCIVMAAAYAATVDRVPTVVVAEVNCLEKENGDVCARYARGYPTLKLFKGGEVVATHGGPRDVDSLVAFVDRTLALAKAPFVTTIANRDALHTFLNLTTDRPVVVAVEGGVQLSEWENTVRIMRASSAKEVAFATVGSAHMLVPESSEEKVRFAMFDVYDVPPSAVAAVSGATMLHGGATWWFPGVKGGDSLETMMHCATLPRDGMAVLTKENAPFVLATKRPVLFAFGDGETPGYYDIDLMSDALSQNPSMLAVYADSYEHASLRRHMGLEELSKDEETQESDYVLYHASHFGIAEKFVFRKPVDKVATEWLKPLVSSHNHSHPVTKAGAVTEIDGNNWRSAFDFDGRAALVELYHSNCGACQRFAPMYSTVAAVLKTMSANLFVARVDMRKVSLPASSKIKEPDAFPTILYLAPGERPVMYNGTHRAADIARFAARAAGLPYSGTLVGGNIPWPTHTHVGIVLIAMGIVLLTRARRRGRRSYAILKQ